MIKIIYKKGFKYQLKNYKQIIKSKCIETKIAREILLEIMHHNNCTKWK